MRKLLLAITSVFLVLPVISQQLKYPETRKAEKVDEYFGTKVNDPYQWLECDTCPEVEEWVKAQNKVTNSYLEKIPSRDIIRDRLTSIWSFASMSVPFEKTGMTFWSHNSGKQNHSVLFFKKQNEVDGETLLDPNTLSKDGTTALSGFSVSKDGRWLAYSLAYKGSDWNDVFVKEITTGKQMIDRLSWVKFSGLSWKSDGFFYSRYDAPQDGNVYSAKNEYHKVYYHRQGTPQERDILIWKDNDHALRNFGLSVSKDENFAILTASEGTSGSAVQVADISKWTPEEKINFIPMVEDFENDYEFIGNIEKGLLFLTNRKASNQRLILVDPKKPSEENWITLVEESNAVLEAAYIAGGKLLLKYLRNVQSQLMVHSLDGKFLYEIPLPVIGKVNEISTDEKKQKFYFSMVSYTFPPRVYSSDLETKISEVYFQPEIDFKSVDYVTKQVFYTSKDGTKVPMFITHKKDLKITGDNPVFLFGYGGFNISYTPEFRVDRTVFLENGGIYCVANIRGGGEFGEEWHKAGTKLQKQNVFDDFISAAEFLIKEGYTNKNRIAIHGRSNGGLLAGACLTQRPDLFKCVIPQVGVLDMLKFHKFTIGWAWTADYGSSENSKEEFEYLYNYSPVHNVKKGEKYPATLVVTGDHDDRVVPAHSFKFIAELQEKQGGTAPVLVRIDTGGGHGSGKPLSMQIAEYADMWSFVFHQLDMKAKKK